MKHLKVIEDMLSGFHEPWMDSADKAQMNQELLKATGLTLEQLDADIETGVQNGFSVQSQMILVKRLIQTLKSPPSSTSSAGKGSFRAIESSQSG